MGKKSGSSSSKKGGGNAQANKCVCDHPFQCSCGNRPERPSKGHKWDPTTQQWGGKGHKQKGASGQTASVGTEAKTTKVGKTQIAQWQKLPSTILHEWCKKQKRPQPKFKEVLNDHTKSKFKTRVILNDPKNPDKDLFFVPKDSVNNEEQAQEEAALLALLQLTPSLPHERKLPEPYKTTWLNTIQAVKGNSNKTNSNKNRETTKNTNTKNDGNNTKSSGGGGGGGATSSSGLSSATSFTSAAERRRHAELQRQQRNARVRKHEAVRMANRDHPVFLSARLRSQIQSLLRGGDVSGTDTETEDGDDIDDSLDVFESDLQCYVEERLHHEGFTKRQARKSFDSKKSQKWTTLDEDEWEHVYEECLQWLCVHLDENDLPEGFDPRGSTLEVVAPNKIVKASSSQEGSDNPTSSASKNVSAATAAIAGRYGLTVKDALWLQQQQKDDSSKEVKEIFWNRICKLAEVSLKDRGIESTDNTNSNSSKNKVLVEEEFEAIEAIFPEESTKTSNKEAGTSTVVIKTPDDIDLQFTFDDLYPSTFPTNVLFVGKWPQPIGVAFHVEIVKFLSTLSLGEPMMFEVFSHAQTLLQTLDELPKGMSLSNNEASQQNSVKEQPNQKHMQDVAASSSKLMPPTILPIETQAIKKRPRNRGTFWSQPPNKTKPAAEFGWSKSIEKQRKSLPAWKARNEFLSVLNQASKASRVVLVTGDTGCGKVCTEGMSNRFCEG